MGKMKNKMIRVKNFMADNRVSYKKAIKNMQLTKFIPKKKGDDNGDQD